MPPPFFQPFEKLYLFTVRTTNVFLLKAVTTQGPLLVSGLVFSISANCRPHFQGAPSGKISFKSLWYKDIESACEYFMTPVHW